MDNTKKLARQLDKVGCKVDRTSKGHLKIRCPGGAVVYHSKTSSDWRSERNLRSQLRRAGVNL